MILRLSKKLATKLKVPLKAYSPLDPNPFADWSAHLFTADRTQYILITNTASLYSVITYGRGIADDGQFLDEAITAMREYMVIDETEFIFKRLVSPSSTEVCFSKALNRSVTGSMNDLVSCAKFELVQREMSPFETAPSLNEMPMSALVYRNPREAFKELDAGHTA